MAYNNTNSSWDIYECDFFCKAINSNHSCTQYDDDDDVLMKCKDASTHCDCRPEEVWSQTAAWIAVEALIGCLFILIIIIRIVVVRIKNRKLKAQTGQHTVIAQQPIVSTVNVEQQLGNFGASPFNLRQQCAIATPIPQMTQWSSEKSQPPTYYTYS